eukprot:14420544-Alexandrium_andersonii.AAC.1
MAPMRCSTGARPDWHSRPQTRAGAMTRGATLPTLGGSKSAASPQRSCPSRRLPQWPPRPQTQEAGQL